MPKKIVMNKFKIKEINDSEDFDPSILCQNTPFTQAGFYGDWQKALGRVVRRFLISKDSEVIGYFQIIKYPLIFQKHYLYIPYGPVIKDFSEDLLKEIKEELKKIAKSENAVFVRLDFTPPISNTILSRLFTKSFFCTYHSAYFQPRTEWFLGLEKSENEILMDMKQNTRYSIKQAQKREIVTDIITKDFEKYFEIFYELMLGTAKRNGFSLHKKDYYENIFKNLSQKNSYLIIAKYGEKILVVDVIIVFGKIVNYVFGCSSNEERDRLPTYSAQWKAICYAKEIKCDYYNFGGIATENKIYKGWDGLTFFKKKFGGKEVEHSIFFDIIINHPFYYLYNLRAFLKHLLK
jgi:lipid II:glycine glycyltransferase (peptidoglycan interpeptide bridge formation enzyme)